MGFWGALESAPCPLIAAGFCERAARGGEVLEAARFCGSVVQVAGPFCAGGDLARGRPRGRDVSSQPYLGPRGLLCPGDMMIDWVSPPAGMRPLSLIRPSAWPVEAGRRRLAAVRRELAAVVPIG